LVKTTNYLPNSLVDGCSRLTVTRHQGKKTTTTTTIKTTTTTTINNNQQQQSTTINNNSRQTVTSGLHANADTYG
jgi:hypothetical protein